MPRGPGGGRDDAPSDLALVRKIIDGDERHLVTAPLRRHRQIDRRVGWTKASWIVDDEKYAHGPVGRARMGRGDSLQIGPAAAVAQHPRRRIVVNA